MAVTGDGTDLRAARADVEALVTLLARLPRAHYDPHGWFICNGCLASFTARRVLYDRPGFGQPLGHLEAGDGAHLPTCPWPDLDATVQRLLGDLHDAHA